MARNKNKRKISFVPKCQFFVPDKLVTHEVIKLLSDEIEAIYLIDILEDYQEEAAFKMGVSRPTFARILKSARQKIAATILMAQTLELATFQKERIIAFCINEAGVWKSLHSRNKYICIVVIDQFNEIIKTELLDNPLYASNLKPTLALTPILIQHRVDCYVVAEIGEGFKSTLQSKGVTVLVQNSFSL